MTTTANIALITDKNQKEGLFNVIQSILQNSSYENCKRYFFYIIVDQNPEIYQSELASLFPQIEYHLISLDNERYKELTDKIINAMVVHHDHSYTRNVMVFISLFLPDLFPRLQKCLYLDVDMIVQTDLCDLYDVDLSEQPIASPLILNAKYHHFAAELNIDSKVKNFNSGIYVLDFNYWRENSLSEKCFEIMKRHKQNKLFRFASQPIINLLFTNNVKDVSSSWNVRLKNLSKHFINIGPLIIKNKAKVLHWAGPSKGWHQSNKFHNLWSKYIPMQKKKIDVLMLATDHINIYTQYSIPIWEKYCEIHDYRFFHYKEKLLDDMAFTWSRIKMIQDHFKTTDADYVAMVDADTFLYNKNLHLSFEELINQYMKEGQKILFQKDGSDRLGMYFSHNFKLSKELKRWTLPNAGFNIMENCKEVHEFIDYWIELGRGKLKHLADIHPRTQNVLLRGVLQNPEMDKLVGYLPSKVVSKRNTSFCKHLSAMSKEDISIEIKKEYSKIFK